ncbi:hypothetical protein, partial [Kozakia baliensis]|uniref:hypothetical protein n=1 Tax=Kozakia baliensis TaxID=153496 RepID=UPI002231A0DC
EKQGRDLAQEARLTIRARQAERQSPRRLAEIDAQIRQLLKDVPVLMSDREQKLRRERAGYIVAPDRGARPSSKAPGM